MFKKIISCAAAVSLMFGAGAVLPEGRTRIIQASAVEEYDEGLEKWEFYPATGAWTKTYTGDQLALAISNGDAEFKLSDQGFYVFGCNVQVGHMKHAKLTLEVHSTKNNIYNGVGNDPIKSTYMWAVGPSWNNDSTADLEKHFINYETDENGDPLMNFGAVDFNNWDSGSTKFNGQWAQFAMTDSDLQYISIKATIVADAQTTWEYYPYDDERSTIYKVFNFMSGDSMDTIETDMRIINSRMKANAHVHDYAATSTTLPECWHYGYTTYTCKYCGDYYNDDIDNKMSEHSYVSEVTEPSTCIKKGTAKVTCPVCGVSHNEELPLGEHFYETRVVGAPCEAGSYGHTCKYCGDNYYTDREALEDHDYVFSEVYEPGCKTQGFTIYKCTKCGDSYKADYTQATGHKYVSKILEQPTCTKEGRKQFTCSQCGDVYDEILPKTDHKYVVTDKIAPTYDEEGETVYKCSVCGDTKLEFTAKLKRTSIAKATVTGISDRLYTGSAYKPAPTVKLNGKTLKKGTDYTVSYKNNKAIGKATVTITGKGAYNGKVTKTFMIYPKPTTIKSLTSPKTKQIKVVCKKTTGVTGYQISYSTSKKFTKSTTKTVNVTSTSKTIKSLKKGKTYYVKVRTYKKVGSSRLYSTYTAVKKIKVK